LRRWRKVHKGHVGRDEVGRLVDPDLPLTLLEWLDRVGREREEDAAVVGG